MDKAPDAFRTISEVADAIAIPAHVLRFWESRFPQIKPVKRAGGRRYYRPSDVALVAGIQQLLHKDGLTIRAVQQILREQGVRHVATLGGAKSADLDRAAAEALAPVVPRGAPALAQVVPLTPAPRKPIPTAPQQAATIQSLFPLDPAPPTRESHEMPVPRRPRPPTPRSFLAEPDQPSLPFILEPEAPEAPHIWVEEEAASVFDLVPLRAKPATQAGSTAQALAHMAALLQALPAPAAGQSQTSLRDLHTRLSLLNAQMDHPPRRQS
jgi:DNA-binding transcriptional MerR regulator